MADRACRNFKPNVFNNNKCQNCFKLREAHSSSVTASDVSFQSLTRKQSAQKVQNTESSIDSKTVYFTLYISLYIYCRLQFTDLDLAREAQIQSCNYIKAYSLCYVRFIQESELWSNQECFVSQTKIPSIVRKDEFFLR